MSRLIVLDTSPLGMLVNPFRSVSGTDILTWAREHIQAGNRLVVPAVADYELRRELTRRSNFSALRLLDQFNKAAPDRYLPLSDAALRRAASLWAEARNRGTPTADPRELDCDVLIAAQAITMFAGSDDI